MASTTTVSTSLSLEQREAATLVLKELNAARSKRSSGPAKKCYKKEYDEDEMEQLYDNIFWSAIHEAGTELERNGEDVTIPGPNLLKIVGLMEPIFEKKKKELDPYVLVNLQKYQKNEMEEMYEDDECNMSESAKKWLRQYIEKLGKNEEQS